MKKNKSSKYHSCSNVWNSENSNVFSIKLLLFFVEYFNRCVDLGKIFENEIYFFSFGQNMKKDNNGQSWVLLYMTKDGVR